MRQFASNSKFSAHTPIFIVVTSGYVIIGRYDVIMNQIKRRFGQRSTMSHFLQSAKTSSRDRRCAANSAGKRRKSWNGHWLSSQIGIAKFIRINVCTLHPRCTAPNTNGPQGQPGAGSILVFLVDFLSTTATTFSHSQSGAKNLDVFSSCYLDQCPSFWRLTVGGFDFNRGISCNNFSRTRIN